MYHEPEPDPPPVIHNPQAEVRKYEEDQRQARRKETAVMNLRNIKILTERVDNLEKEINEIHAILKAVRT